VNRLSTRKRVLRTNLRDALNAEKQEKLKEETTVLAAPAEVTTEQEADINQRFTLNKQDEIAGGMPSAIFVLSVLYSFQIMIYNNFMVFHT
jgi:hypothetical protein